MLSIELSNSSRLQINLSLRDKSVTITQHFTLPDRPPATISIPLPDLKLLVSSVRTLISFF